MADLLTAFATAADMAERSQGRIPATTPFLSKELAAATRAIRDICGWHVADKQQIRVRRRFAWCSSVWIPAMQIESIDAAVVDGVTLDASAIDFDPETGWTDLRATKIDLTFTAGFDPVPENLVQLTLEVAAGGLLSSSNINREQAGAVSVGYTRSSGGLLASDHDRLTAYILGRLP